MVRASMDADCNVSMDAHAPLGMPGLAGKLTVHQGKNDLIQGTALYHGESVCCLLVWCCLRRCKCFECWCASQRLVTSLVVVAPHILGVVVQE